MRMGFVLCFFIFPVFLEECCNRKWQKKKRGLQQFAAHQHYRVVEGEIFMMPCNESNPDVKTVWFRTEDGTEGNIASSFDCGRDFLAEVKHSGKYTSSNGMSMLSLQVVEKVALGCFQFNETIVRLKVHMGGTIVCPGFTCSNNKDVIWYKKNKSMSEQDRDFCEEEGTLRLCTVYEYDSEIFFCDRQITEQGVTWTFRRAVNVTVIAAPENSSSPKIDYPTANTTEEVEIEPSAKVQWFMNYGGDMKNMTPLRVEKPQWEKRTFEWSTIKQRAIIKEVTLQHLNHTYTCIASSTAGKASVTITLKRKIQVKWPSLLGYPFAAFILVAGLGIIVYVKRLELELIYRSHFQCGKHDGENKEFDVFLSLVWSPPSAQEHLTFSSRSGPLLGEEHLSKEGNTTQTALEVLLPQVLEDQWGYHLCLLERDVLPGGAYTNDVVLRIKRSQMLICVLSAEYLANSNAVFVLESGVQAVLQKSALKLLLIWTHGASATLTQPDPPLPKVVQRALRVLPSLEWSSDKSSSVNSHFWSSLRKAIPDRRGRLVSLIESQ